MPYNFTMGFENKATYPWIHFKGYNYGSFTGPKYEYHWADGQTVKRPIKCSAPKYIDYLMTWAQDQLDDESLFPSKIGKQMST